MSAPSEISAKRHETQTTVIPRGRAMTIRQPAELVAAIKKIDQRLAAEHEAMDALLLKLRTPQPAG